MSHTGQTANRAGAAAAGGAADVFHGEVDPARAHQDILRGLDGKQACPFCGSVSEKTTSPCSRCGMDNTPEARKATKARIGPWYVLQARNPAAPGMRFETLLSFVRKGRVRARSVVRGPTTHQLWRFAAHVKGLSREFGLCYSCGSQIEHIANVCPQCNRLQEPPINPDVLLEDGEDAVGALARPPVYRELPAPPVDVSPPSRPEEADIIIPALGGFAADDLDPRFSETPVAAGEPAPAAPPARPAPAAFDVPSPGAPRAEIAATASAPAPAPTPRTAAPVAKGVNPFTIPPARKKNAADNAFLSAKELAAAFKLSFDPSANMDAVEVPDQMPAAAMPPGGAIVPRGSGSAGLAASTSSSTALATTTTVYDAFDPYAQHATQQPTRGSRWRAFKKFVLFVMILAGTGFAVLMWVDPSAREKTIQHSKQTYRKLYRYATGADARPPLADDPAALLDSSKVPDPAPPEPDSAAFAPSSLGADNLPVNEAPPAREDARTAAETDVPPPPAPVAAEAAVVSVKPAGEQPAMPSEGTEKPKEGSGATAEEAVPAPANQTPAERIRELYARGIQAAGRGNYDAALRDYASIKRYPASDWPSDLGTRIDYATKQLAKQQQKPPAK